MWRRDWVTTCSLTGLLFLAGCADTEVPGMPVPVSNNAVAVIGDDDGDGFEFYSFLGLGEGKTWRDISNRAFRYDSRAKAWMEIEAVPGSPRLAGTAIGVNGAVYVMGGYTVAEDGSEKSDPGVYRFDPGSQSWSELSAMPVPVDDSVSLAYRGRYIYLVSGWHDTDNVDKVQVYDTVTDTWQAVTPYPGTPVFGHAGGMAGERMVICDGVKVVPPEEEGGRRSFEASPECWLGTVSASDVTVIEWEPLEHHPGPALYRMAAVGTKTGGPRVLFAGGSDNPYNYDGTGYDGEPSTPVATVFSFDLETLEWRRHEDLETPVMDLRGLLESRDGFFMLGGMTADQTVTNRVQVYTLHPTSQ